MGRDKGSLIKKKKQKTNPKQNKQTKNKHTTKKKPQRPHTEAKGNKILLCFPSAASVWPLPRNQDFSLCKGCSEREMP